MERTIYSKYSNERARKFCIRTDIVIDDAGEKKVYKYALTPEGHAHLAQIPVFCQKLNEAYQASAISFCSCTMSMEMRRTGCVAFPFLKGSSLQDLLKRAIDEKDDKKIEYILREYIYRVSKDGGDLPFVVTEAFTEIFGILPTETETILNKAGKNGIISAKISDIDMVFSNIFVESGDIAVSKTKWQVIDYEWSFDFPIPKGFLIYRALYFAYYQVLYHTNRSLEQLLGMAGITEEEGVLYQRMEEHFQKYLASGAIPVRNMQRAMGTRIITLRELLAKAGTKGAAADVQIPEEKWLHVRKIRYQIDRKEYQDGGNVCSGWAFASTWDGICYPVNIQVRRRGGKPIVSDVSRRERKDVADAFGIRRVTNPVWGFDCVWIAPKDEEWEIHFSLGRKECTYQSVGHL